MAEKIVILKIGDVGIGAIIFDDSPTELNIRRTAANINLMIPAAIELRWNDRKQPCPLLTNLRAVISMRDPYEDKVELGRVRDDSVYYGVTSQERHLQKAVLFWVNALPALVFIEKNRAGRRPKLQIEVRGELCYLVNVMGAPPQELILTKPLTYVTRTPPRAFRDEIEVSYPEDVWVKMIQKAF